ncbi:hypothetical protein JHK86_039963 [Glycine max]|nr:hypothetical protein JHK86_039963 [Glycine max]
MNTLFDSNQNVRKPEGRVDQSNAGVARDPLGEIMKILYEVYMNPVELPWEASRFGIPNIDAKFYIIHADMAEIISGHNEPFCRSMMLLLSMLLVVLWRESMLGGVDGDPVLRGTRIRATWECVSSVERWATGDGVFMFDLGKWES